MESATLDTRAAGRVGDWLLVHGLPGLPPRRGQILEVIGRPERPPL